MWKRKEVQDVLRPPVAVRPNEGEPLLYVRASRGWSDEAAAAEFAWNLDARRVTMSLWKRIARMVSCQDHDHTACLCKRRTLGFLGRDFARAARDAGEKNRTTERAVSGSTVALRSGE